MATVVYILCALTSLICTALLVRGYRRSRTRLLLWSALCFSGLFLENVLLIIDLLVFPEVDLSPLRVSVSAASVVLLLTGLIWEST